MRKRWQFHAESEDQITSCLSGNKNRSVPEMRPEQEVDQAPPRSVSHCEPAAVRGAGNGPEKGPTAALLPGSGLFTRHQNLRSGRGEKPSFDAGVRSLFPACCHSGIYSQKSLSFPTKSMVLPLLFMSRRGGGGPECVAWGDPSPQGGGVCLG